MESDLFWLFVSTFVIIGLCDIALVLVEYLGEKKGD